MTLYVHTTEQDSYCEIQWAMATSSVGGVIKIAIGSKEDRAILAEIFALDLLLARYPGKAGSIETSSARLKKIFRGADCFAKTELAALALSNATLSIDTHKNTAKRCAAALSLVSSPATDNLDWRGVSRPRIPTSIGDLEVTEHAMERYRERFGPTAKLSRLVKLLARQAFKVDDSLQDGIPCEVYSIPETGIRFVVANETDRRRLLTFYRVA